MHSSRGSFQAQASQNDEFGLPSAYGGEKEKLLRPDDLAFHFGDLRPVLGYHHLHTLSL